MLCIRINCVSSSCATWDDLCVWIFNWCRLDLAQYLNVYKITYVLTVSPWPFNKTCLQSISLPAAAAAAKAAAAAAVAAASTTMKVSSSIWHYCFYSVSFFCSLRGGISRCSAMRTALAIARRWLSDWDTQLTYSRTEKNCVIDFCLT